MSKIKVLAYERVSTENQVTDWNWILGQQWAIDAYCLGKGYDVNTIKMIESREVKNTELD